jgi:CofD-related protein of GAK system
MSSGRTPAIRLSRQVELPDPMRVALCSRAPELGPRILFFSGGTALRETSRRLVRYTHNSIHLITPFDSGGSSAALRRAFGLLAVGDLRNRIMALADRSVQGHPEVVKLFAFRFPKGKDQAELYHWLERMVMGEEQLVAAIPHPMRKIIRDYLSFFLAEMPTDFDLRGANIGNLILVGGLLNHGNQMDPVVYLFSKLVNARGVVRSTTNEDLHLAAELEDGRFVVGQHLLAGKETAPLESAVERLFLTTNPADPTAVEIPLKEKVRQLISEADVICYPMGSFYTSVIANFLVHGVGQAVAERAVPKVYVPNLGHDPEQRGMTINQSVDQLLKYLRRSSAGERTLAELLQYVLVDVDAAGLDSDEIRRLEGRGLQVVNLDLVTPDSAPFVDGDRLAQVLISLC